MAMSIQKQSRKFIKPSIPTPLNLRHYKIGFTDEFAPVMNVSMALFFTVDRDNNPRFITQLEQSLEKTLTRFYPLAGRYVEKVHIVDCNDKGAEFTHAQVNIKLQDVLDSDVNLSLIDEFLPSKTRVADQFPDDPILATQVTTFQCGGVALGVSIPHRIVDASTLCTFLNEWATISREENEAGFIGLGIHSSSLFPARGLTPLGVKIPASISNDLPSMNVTKKISFSETVISNMKVKAMLDGKHGNRQLSRVQLISGLLWEVFIDVERAIHGYSRDSVLLQPVNLREKTASLIPKNSFGNLWGLLLTKCKTAEGLACLLRDSIKKAVNNYSKVCHDSDEGQTMVLNSFSQITDINPSTTNVIWLTSWCKFPFYEADFGFGKPIWANYGSSFLKNSVYLMDDAEGNGVEAYVCLEAKDVHYFEQALNLKAFAIGLSSA